MQFTVFSQIEAVACFFGVDDGFQAHNLCERRSQEEYEQLVVVENADLVKKLLLDLVAVLLDDFEVVNSQRVELDSVQLFIAILQCNRYEHVILEPKDVGSLGVYLDGVWLSRSATCIAEVEGSTPSVIDARYDFNGLAVGLLNP